jgi:glutathione S-transferase
MPSQSASARKTAEMQAEVPAETGFVLRVSKRLKAPRALVFKMFTDGAHLARWFGPLGHTCTECVVEPKVGGRFYAALTGPDGALRRVEGVFTEVTSDRRLAFTWAWLDEAGQPREPDLKTLVTITFEPKGDETELTLRHDGFPNAERAGMHDKGWESSFDCLAQYLAEHA